MVGRLLEIRAGTKNCEAMMRLAIPVDWRLPEAIHRRLGDTAGRQRAIAADSHLLLVLHEPPVPGVATRVGRFFWRDPEGSWKGSPFGDGIQSLKRHVTEFSERVDQLETQWQDADTAAEYFAMLQIIAPLHRTTRNLYAALQEARELVPGDRDLINQRDRVGEIERAIELLHGDARNGLDYTVAHQAEIEALRSYEMAVAAHRLNLLAAAFFPLATLAAIFGMNLSSGLEHPALTGVFWAIVIIGLMCGFGLAWLVANRPPPPRVPSAKKSVPSRRK
jgi:CorA-like Mg2+ transporter protein